MSEQPEGLQTVIGSERDDGKIYAGSNQWLEKEAWGTLFRASTDSLFCRMATSVYWTPEQLRSRSVTGTLSNKSRAKGVTEPRPALTPEKVASLKALFGIFMGCDVPEEEQKKKAQGCAEASRAEAGRRAEKVKMFIPKTFCRLFSLM
ncbi:uncharacterized protein LOC119446462 [Dermacentor silvarum]|nr:uncharacterized protein LOC119446462 [Dermacentor silvarum]